MAEDTKKDAIATRPPAAMAVPSEITGMIQSAIDKGLGVEAVEKLVALHERITDRLAASEFAHALADFQNECPPIQKTSTAEIVNRNTGSRFSYRYVELDAIARTVNPLLHERGLSYSWDSKVDDGRLSVVCTLRHVNGHSERSTFACAVESTKQRSAAQDAASTLTFGKRQSLIQVLGLTTCDPDSDAAPQRNLEPITEDQAANLEALIQEVRADRARFLRYLGVPDLDAIPQEDYSRAVRALEDKRNRGR